MPLSSFSKMPTPNQKSRFLNYTRYINQSNDRYSSCWHNSKKNSASRKPPSMSSWKTCASSPLPSNKNARTRSNRASPNRNPPDQCRHQPPAAKPSNCVKTNNASTALSPGISAKQQADKKAQADERTQAAKQRAQAASEAQTSTLTNEDLALQDNKPANSSGFSRRQSRLPMPQAK